MTPKQKREIARRFCEGDSLASLSHRAPKELGLRQAFDFVENIIRDHTNREMSRLCKCGHSKTLHGAFECDKCSCVEFGAKKTVKP